MPCSDRFLHPFAVVAALAVAAPLVACDSIIGINSNPTPSARSYDCDMRGACGSFRLGAPNTDVRGGTAPSSEEDRRDSATILR
jgi:hypothetical protein